MSTTVMENEQAATESVEVKRPWDSKRILNAVGRFALTIFLLYLFLVGISCFGSGIKLMGGGFAKTLFGLSTNAFVGVFCGLLATALFQSSSATTSIIVGLVSAGTVGIEGAVPMIMGANIGTSVTNTFVSLGHIGDKEHFKRAFSAATVHDFFNFLSVAIFLPLEMATGFLSKSATWLASALYGGSAGLKYKSPIKAAIKPAAGAIKGAVTSVFDSGAGIVLMIVSTIIIIAALALIVRNMRKLVESNAAPYISKVLSHPVTAIFFGVLVTVSVQSSSITTSLLVPMAGAGLLTIETIFPITIGANIGTTATALLAALAGNVHGLAIALVHFLFNVSGMLFWYPIPRIRRIPIACSEKLAELALKNKAMAIGYIAGVFFLLPLLLILITK